MPDRVRHDNRVLPTSRILVDLGIIVNLFIITMFSCRLSIAGIDPLKLEVTAILTSFFLTVKVHPLPSPDEVCFALLICHPLKLNALLPQD